MTNVIEICTVIRARNDFYLDDRRRNRKIELFLVTSIIAKLCSFVHQRVVNVKIVHAFVLVHGGRECGQANLISYTILR